jgi:hypothetical protein
VLRGAFRRGPLDRGPAGIRLALGALGPAAAAQAEQPLGVQQVDRDGHVDDERHHLQHGDALDQLVDLVRDEDDRRDERQVLRPPLGEPEPDRLDALKQRVPGDGRADQVEVPDADREQVLQVVHDAVLAAGQRAAHSALQVVEDAGELGVQRGAVAGEQQHGGGQRAQHQEVEQPVQGDQPQDVAVAQRLAPERQHDLVPGRRVLPDRMLRRGERQPGVAAHAPVPAQAARFPGEQLVLGTQRGRVRAEDLVAVQPAVDQLVAQLRPEAARLLGSRRRHVRRRRRTGVHRHLSPVIAGA